MSALRLLLLLVAIAGSAIGWTRDEVIGTLGQAVQAATIHASKSSRAGVLSRVRAYQYLVVRKTASTNWVGVVLRNGRMGYIRAGAVAKLPYEVRSSGVRRPSETVSRSGASGDARADIAQYGLRYTGTRYVWGGNSLTRGIDCSGFVQQLFGKIGIDLPRTAAQQALVGQPISRLEDLRPGDRLYFWERRRNKIGHTGIYLGNGYFVHSSSGRRGVATDDLRAPNWRRILVAARR